MRLRIDTNNVRFRVAGLAQPRMESKDSKVQKTTPAPDKRPIWTVRLIAIDGTAASMETIWVEVAGEQPQLALDEIAAVQGLVFSPWVNRKNEIVRSFRADSVTIETATRRTAA
jgi:hypothetical protein